MKTILWMCNVKFSNEQIKETGSWLQPLIVELAKQPNFKFINVTVGSVNKVIRCDFDNVIQFIIPYRKSDRYSASPKTCNDVLKILEEFSPDLVHIWGTESIWTSIYQQGFVKHKTLIDIQGLLYIITDYYYGGLSFSEILQTISLKEIIMPWRLLFQKKNNFAKRGKVEMKYLQSFKNIAYQSSWVYNQLKYLNDNANYYPTKIMLRENFYNAPSWTYRKTDSPIIFSSASAAVTYKGLHILIKSVALLKQKYPKIQLRLAGKIDVGDKLLDGYSIFLRKLIRKYNLEENVFYLGPINAEQIIKELLSSSVCVIPSFIETYCLALAESLILGVPTVISFAGAMPELADNMHDALFYNSNDYRMCASNIDLLLTNTSLAEKLSMNSRIKRKRENDPIEVVKTQIDIYNSIL